VCSGNRGFNKHFSDLVSLTLEPLSHASSGAEVNSADSFQYKIRKLNEQRRNGDQGMKELIEGVNMFIEEVKPEDLIGPMICNSSIKLNGNELRFLTREQKYMIRNEIDIKEFTVDLEKMM